MIAGDVRGGAGVALAAAAGDPGAWALALLGFMARGGVLLLALPVLSVPSPVLLSMLFRGEVGAIGRGEARVLAIGVGFLLSLVAIGGVILSAYADVALAERFVADPETDGLRHDRSPRPLTAPQRRSLVWWVASVQAVALIPIIVALTMVIDGAVRAASNELIDPSATDLPLAARVLPAIGTQLLLAGLVLILVEMLSSLASRRLMASAWGLLPRTRAGTRDSVVALGAFARLVRTPLRVVATALLGWLTIGLTVGLVLLSSWLAWNAARDVLVTGGAGSGPAVVVVAAALVGLFVAVWVAGLGLIGFASTVRSGLWTADALR